MNILNNVLNELKENKALRESGKYIGLPLPFPRMRQQFPYITKGRYIITTANSKIGKTQITDFLFLYWVFIFQKEMKTNFKFKIFYFSLEMAKEDKIKAAISFFLYYYKGIKMGADKLASQYDSYILEDKMLHEIESIKPIMDEFLKMVEFIDEIRNPYGIYKYCEDYAEKNGKYTYKTMDWTDEKTGKTSKKEVIDTYVQDDPDEFRIVISDHGGLLIPEKEDNGDLRSAMGRFSSQMNIKLRNRFKYLIVMVQQQAQAQEGVENAKLNMLKPTQAGLGDNKTTGRDVDLMFGLFAPNRYGIKTHDGFDITQLRDNYREFITIFNRRGSSVSTDLYFDGEINYFKELPKANEMTRKTYEDFKNGKFKTKLT